MGMVEFYHGNFERDNSLKIGIYKIYHIKTPTLIYIGSASKTKGSNKYSVGFYSRWTEHLYELRKNKHHSKYLQRIANKHGIGGIRFEIIKLSSTPAECIVDEQIYLNKYNPAYNSLKVAYSSFGFKHSKETLIKMSNGRKGIKLPPMTEETKQKMSEIGKKRDLSYLRTAEMREKVAKKLRGVKRPNFNSPSSKKINQYDLLGNFIRSYDSMGKASAETKIDRSSINHCALGNRVSCGGFLWSYNHEVNLPNGYLIIQYDMNGNKVNSYAYMAEVINALKLSSGTAIRNCFIGKQYQAYGFKWVKEYPPLESKILGLSKNRLDK